MGTMIGSLVLYTLARLVLVIVLAVAIYFIGGLFVQIPAIVAAMFGVLIALPLGMFLFKPLRLRVNSQVAAIDAERRKSRDDLQSRLRGSK
ncbi:DUF4229 domain-containing protein [Gordonia sp. TBRC 11910]|uniref:DUF4229 domain-containing protein n=2 Tax=Gordonia asplenii TaxID=2725283 RepID=A0A848KZT1_9ACTN|nr:DUF4229 domain-containing protein [Gordonia asplenii]